MNSCLCRCELGWGCLVDLVTFVEIKNKQAKNPHQTAQLPRKYSFAMEYILNKSRETDSCYTFSLCWNKNDNLVMFFILLYILAMYVSCFSNSTSFRGIYTFILSALS